MYNIKVTHNNVTGDLVNVIEKDHDGCEGWWMCEFEGRRGIAPGNRLEIIEVEEEDNFDTYDVPRFFHKIYVLV